MPTTDEAKRMARALRDALGKRDVTLTHSQSLELIAQTLDFADWNTLAARTEDAAGPKPLPGVQLEDAIPILRSFDAGKARAFYVDLLGFKVDFEHRFEPSFPLFMQVSRGDLRLHISEHHGDATPGSGTYIYLQGLDAFHAEITARGSRAGIEEGPAPNMRVLKLWDPASNRLVFAELSQAKAAA